jgi:phosphomethylpyrimidine synthase
MCGPHFCSMKITEDVRKYAAEQKLSETDALCAGMEQKAREFVEKGAEIYANGSARVSRAGFGVSPKRTFD